MIIFNLIDIIISRTHEYVKTAKFRNINKKSDLAVAFRLDFTKKS